MIAFMAGSPVHPVQQEQGTGQDQQSGGQGYQRNAQAQQLTPKGVSLHSKCQVVLS